MASKSNPIARVQAALVRLDSVAADAARLMAPVAKALKKELDALKVANLPPGTASDLMYLLRQSAKAPATVLASFGDVFGPFDKVLEEHFIATLAAGESSGVQGTLGRVQVTTSSVPTVENWPAFYAYIARTKAWDLMNKVPSVKGIRERWEDKKQVPGVKPFIVKKVSVTKIGGK